MQYGQFCPVAKAVEIVGERWTLLIIRELLMGARRFSELQRGLGAISPALLAARLKSFEADGLLVRRHLNGQRGYGYFPTAACEELLPVILSLGEWGLCWTRHRITADDFDVELLILYLQRSIDPAEMPGSEAVIKFKFRDFTEQPDWWLLVRQETVDICVTDPGRDVDVFFNTTVRTMTEVWTGDRSYREATLAGDLTIEGDPALTRRISTWLRPSVFAKSRGEALPTPPASAGAPDLFPTQADPGRFRTA